MAYKTVVSICVFLSITCLLFSEAQNKIPKDVKFKVDQLIAEFMKFNNMVGLGLAIVKNNSEILYTTGYGFRNVEKGLAADDTTLFAIGSVTKSFTAIVVVRALQEIFPELGEAALDTPIRKLAPTYNFTLSDSRQRYAPEECQFRTGFVYNNPMIAVAGEIIAHIAKSTFEKMLQTLLTDIGMTDSTWIKDSDDHNSMPGRSVPYWQIDGQLKKLNPEMLKIVITDLAAGGILSSARDMAKYMQFHLNHGKVGDVQVVPEKAMKWLYRASNIIEHGSFKSLETDRINKIYAYALCLSLGTYDGWQIVHHGGWIGLYETQLTLVPDFKLGIFTTTNGPDESEEEFSREMLHNFIYDILRGRHVTPPPPVKKGAKNSETKPKPKIHPNPNFKVEESDIVGHFGSAFAGQVKLSFRENASGALQLYMSYGRYGQAWLTQVTNSSFEITWIEESENDSEILSLIEFLDINTFNITLSGEPIGTPFKRNKMLADFPVIPWEPDSCSPERLSTSTSSSHAFSRDCNFCNLLIIIYSVILNKLASFNT